MFQCAQSKEPHGKKNTGLLVVFALFGIAFILSIVLVFVYTRSESTILKSFAEMQEIGKTQTIQGCVQKNMEWYSSCTVMAQLCDQSITKMMRICLVNGDKSAQCAQYGDKIYGSNFGGIECTPYYSNKPLKKACADTYQSIADYCKAVRKIPSNAK